MGQGGAADRSKAMVRLAPVHREDGALVSGWAGGERRRREEAGPELGQWFGPRVGCVAQVRPGSSDREKRGEGGEVGWADPREGRFRPKRGEGEV